MPRAGWHVYIVRCSDESYYTGIARDLDRRLAQHDAGKGAKYTRGRGPVTLLWTERKRTQGSALKREAEIKRWPRAEKAKLTRCGSSVGVVKSIDGRVRTRRD